MQTQRPMKYQQQMPALGIPVPTVTWSVALGVAALVVVDSTPKLATDITATTKKRRISFMTILPFLTMHPHREGERRTNAPGLLSTSGHNATFFARSVMHRTEPRRPMC
jgi:hypothetical protein